MLDTAVKISNIFAMLFAAGTLGFGAYTYIRNIERERCRRIRDILLKSERESLYIDSQLAQPLYVSIAKSIVEEIEGMTGNSQDISLINSMLSKDNNHMKASILLGIQNSDKAVKLKDVISLTNQTPFHIREDLRVVSNILSLIVASMLTKVAHVAISPTLFDNLLEDENISQFRGKMEGKDSYMEYINELVLYLASGPNSHMNTRGQRILDLSGEFISILVRVYVNSTDSQLTKSTKSQPGIYKNLTLDSNTVTGDIRILLESIKSEIPRDEYESMITVLTRIEETASNNAINADS